MIQFNPFNNPALIIRESRESLKPLRHKVLLDTSLFSVLQALSDPALVINAQRQVLAANKALLDTFHIRNIEAVIGQRPGEIIGCVFSTVGPDGCGTAPNCTACGALMAILESQELKRKTEREFRVTLEDGTAIDLLVTSTPIAVEAAPLFLCVLKDISAEKRRLVLEKVFFHDVMNTVGSIRNVACLLAHPEALDAETDAKYRQWMTDLSDKLIDEISHQQKLVAAEQGVFRPHMEVIYLKTLLREVQQIFLGHDVSRDRNLVLGEAPECAILSDGAILRRILANMVKNALEASDPGGTVIMQCEEAGDSVAFSVRNEGVIPKEVQLQLFQRSFTTKGGEGRGIGTYSMKLFGERFLKGKITFASGETEGTVFVLTLPKGIKEAGDAWEAAPSCHTGCRKAVS